MLPGSPDLAPSAPGRVKKTPVPAYQAGCVPGTPGISLPPAHPARKSSAMARPGEPAESFYSSGPGPRLAVATPAIWSPGEQPGRGGDWVATPRKALPWRPACGAFPRTPRTAPPASGPRGGTERNQSVSEARTHPALPVPPPSLIGWTRLEGVASGAEGGGASGLSRQRLCFSGPPARRRERALRWAHCTLESGISRPQGPKGGTRSASTVGPPRCLDATPLLSLIVLACVQEDTVARAHVERRDSPKAYYGLGLC